MNIHDKLFFEIDIRNLYENMNHKGDAYLSLIDIIDENINYDCGFHLENHNDGKHIDIEHLVKLSFFKSHEENDTERIKVYCEKDVVALIQLFLKMKGDALVDEGDIIFS